uniref:non-specific serine/threonine protein kinase n=1 Tax=Kalanchoe fedtschenkoi TaxID=63787 RepID=A0A7N1A177_KALFE
MGTLLLLFWAGFICFGALAVQSQNATCDPDDLRGLTGFLGSIDRGLETWTNSSSFNSSSNCCDWDGVTCSTSSSPPGSEGESFSRVTKLELGRRRLIGNISDSIGYLNQLQVLNLSRNSLAGSLPPSLSNLSKLEVLDLSNNDLVGDIPASYSFPVVHSVDLSDNRLTGSIPSSICSKSSKIKVLQLSLNFFTGSVSNGFQNCTSLEELSVGSNYLSGDLSEELFSLRNLRLLSLSDNQFSGELSGSVGNLSNLVRLEIQQNRLSGRVPDVFGRLGKLQYFLAHSNNFSGAIPASLSSSRSLALLNLRNNSLSGQLGINCSAMTNLSSLDVGTNGFTGPVPQNLPFCHQLKNINLARNKFDGGIPESFRNFHSLSYLSLSNSSISNISSALGILQHCRNLTTLVLTLNFRGEVLPADPTLHFEKLKVLIIASCRLSGSIPTWLSKSTQLQLIDLSWNLLGGTIPAWLGDFNSLFYLDLSNNTLVGEIPRNLTGLRSWITGNISLEEPNPDFPFFLKRDSNVRGLQYNQVLSFPPTLDLSHNFLNGSIWPEFGNLKELHFLDLKYNNLSGNIPSSLSGMSSLESLDLSHNELSGTIPASLVSLSFMSKFSVAYNQLYGRIPTGGQFQTFPNSSFEGNPGLCGDHGYPACEEAERVPVSSPREERRNKGVIAGMAVGIGLGTILFLALLFLIVWRAHSRGAVDPETDGFDADGKEMEHVGSKSVVLFQNKEKELSIDDLLKATNNFDQANIIGCGGFGLVYKATLPDGRKVAIKRLSGDCGQIEREFRAEVETLSRAQHPNLVLLQGYCMYKADRLLIYSYMENSSLDYWLHEKYDGASLLDWEKRLRIAQGAARGLSYLHQACDPHILHRDIKSSNILLDEKFEAHLADFGLARLILANDTHVSTDLVGTLGYIPPEYGQSSVATYMGDVYSFGVVLLELLTGKRPMDICKPRACRDLIAWSLQMKREKKETQVFDPSINNEHIQDQLLRVFDIACLCLNESPKIRPSTQKIVSWLDNVGTKPQ